MRSQHILLVVSLVVLLIAPPECADEHGLARSLAHPVEETVIARREWDEPGLVAIEELC